MKIKKIYQGELPENKILNTESTSQTDTYSCEYINKTTPKIVSFKTTEALSSIDLTPYITDLDGQYEVTISGNSKSGGGEILASVNGDKTAENYIYSRLHISNTTSAVERKSKNVVGYLYARTNINVLNFAFGDGYFVCNTQNTIFSLSSTEALESLSYQTATKTPITSLSEFSLYLENSRTFGAGTVVSILKKA